MKEGSSLDTFTVPAGRLGKCQSCLPREFRLTYVREERAYLVKLAGGYEAENISNWKTRIDRAQNVKY